MSEASQLPPAAVVLHYRVADFDAWKAVFDQSESKRKASGFLGHHINRAEDDPNELNVYFAVADVDQFKAYAESDDVKALMQEAGVVSPPEFMWMTPLREAVVWDRELPAMLISHRVADLDTWLDGYDDADELQRSNGIVGHAANQSMDDPSTIVVYHQAESFDTLRAFMALDELRDTMKEIGVISDPEVTFHTGGWGKQY
jgi:quinol monooxygenase YgiN